MVDMLNEAEREAELLQDQRRLGQASAYMTQCYWWTGQPERAVESGQRAITIAQALGDHALEGLATSGSARPSAVSANTGAPSKRSAVTRQGRGRGSHGRSGQRSFRSAANRAWMAWCLAYLGISPKAMRTPRRRCGWPRRAARFDPGHDLLGSGGDPI